MQINKASPRDECQQWTNAADRLQMEHLNFPVLCSSMYLLYILVCLPTSFYDLYWFIATNVVHSSVFLAQVSLKLYII